MTTNAMARARRRRMLVAHAAILVVSVGGYAVLALGLTSVAPEAVRHSLRIALGIGGGVVAIAIHVVHGTGGTRFATEAERHSSRALRRLERDGWRVVDDVPFGSMNIDHVAIGARGVIAVETTFLPVAAPVGDDGEDPLELALARARKGARRVRLLLKSVRIDASVMPALAVWGRGGGTVAQGATDGVAILAGHEKRQWRDQLPDTGQHLSDDQVRDIERALTRFVEMRHESAARPLSA